MGKCGHIREEEDRGLLLPIVYVLRLAACVVRWMRRWLR